MADEIDAIWKRWNARMLKYASFSNSANRERFAECEDMGVLFAENERLKAEAGKLEARNAELGRLFQNINAVMEWNK